MFPYLFSEFRLKIKKYLILGTVRRKKQTGIST